jgi:hypothetical protein
MFVVEMDLRLGSAGPRLTDDELSDLIEMVVDVLDDEPVAPSVGTRRVGDDVDMTIGVVVDDDDRFEALRHGAAIISAALQAVIGIGAARLVVPSDDPLTSSVRVLQPA